MTFWVAGAAIVGAGVGLYSSNKASNAQVASAASANDELARQYDLTRTDQKAIYDQIRGDQLAQQAQARADAAPGRDAGLRALSQLDTASSPGGAYSQGYQRKAFEEDPGYQFRLSEGDKGIQRAASSRGGLYSGATLKALARFNSDTASQEYGAYDTRENNAENRFNANRDFQRNNLASLAGLGQTATRDVTQAGATATGAIGAAGQNAYGTIAQAGGNMSSGIAQNLTGAGNARASGYVGGANAVSSGIGQSLGYYQNQQLLSALSRGSVPSYGYGVPTGRATDFSQNMQDYGI